MNFGGQVRRTGGTCLETGLIVVTEVTELEIFHKFLMWKSFTFDRILRALGQKKRELLKSIVSQKIFQAS